MAGNLAHYAAQLPAGANGESWQDFPSPQPAKAQTGGSPQTSSIITLSDNTTVLDVAVVGSQNTGIALKWIASTDTTGSVVASGASANFDHVVPSQWRQRFVVPIEKMGVGSASVVGVNVREGLYHRVALIGTGAPVPSVFVAEH